MKQIKSFILPDQPETIITLYLGSTLLDAEALENDDETIVVTYLDDTGSDQEVELTFYVLKSGDEIPDAFPGTYFKRVSLPVTGEQRFIFMRNPARPRKQRPPIVAMPKKGSAAEKETISMRKLDHEHNG